MHNWYSAHLKMRVFTVHISVGILVWDPTRIAPKSLAIAFWDSQAFFFLLFSKSLPQNISKSFWTMSSGNHSNYWLYFCYTKFLKLLWKLSVRSSLKEENIAWIMISDVFYYCSGPVMMLNIQEQGICWSKATQVWREEIKEIEMEPQRLFPQRPASSPALPSNLSITSQ